MLENQFIQFHTSIPEAHNGYVLPVVNDGRGISLFVENPYEGSDVMLDVGLARADGDVIHTSRAILEYVHAYILLDKLFASSNMLISANTLGGAVANMECFRLKVSITNTNGGDITTYYSDLMRLINPDDERAAYYSYVRYLCNEDAFGFPFKSANVAGCASAYLPIRLYEPQYKQEDKIYTKRNGEQVIMYSKMTREYKGETDYIERELHDKIIIALMCDNVTIDGVRVTKSDSYEIDWDKYDLNDHGEKLTRATFKAKENVVSRNSNV